MKNIVKIKSQQPPPLQYTLNINYKLTTINDLNFFIFFLYYLLELIKSRKLSLCIKIKIE